MRLTVEDQLAVVAERVGDLDEVRASLSGERLRGRIAGAREEEEVRGAGLAHGVDDELHRLCPGLDARDVVGLVHDAAVARERGRGQQIRVAIEETEVVQDDALVGAVLLRDLGPDRCELVVRGAALGNDAAVPARVVVQINDDVHVRP